MGLMRFLTLLMLLWADRVLFSGWAVAGWLPDFPLILLIFWLPRVSRAQGVWLGFAIGLLQDLALPGAMGLNALAKSLGAFAAASLPKGRFPKAVLWMPAALLISGGLQLAVHAVYFKQIWAAGAINPLLRYGLPRLVLTLLTGIAAAVVADRIQAWKSGD